MSEPVEAGQTREHKTMDRVWKVIEVNGDTVTMDAVNGPAEGYQDITKYIEEKTEVVEA